MKYLENLLKKAVHHQYGFKLFCCMLAAAITGIGCVAFMRAFEFILTHQLNFQNAGYACCLIMPVLFIISVNLIRRLAPFAAGTGIPQIIFAARNLTIKNRPSLMPLVSMRTMIVKVLTLLIALWAGASTGREGPTVQIAACLYMGTLMLISKWTKLSFDLRSTVIAGGAAGLAAAFNTPLAGVTFAIEELTEDYFGNIKDFVLMAIIFAAIAAKSMIGEYNYFGKLSSPLPISLPTIMMVGLICGALGAVFSSSILYGRKLIQSFHSKGVQYAAWILLPIGIFLLARWNGPSILGPGNQVAQLLLNNDGSKVSVFFPFAKIISTLFTYWSGIAGGIFAPCLSIGASLGSDIGHLMNSPAATCALIGMAGFLSGSIQAPITSFVIIFEMTGHHQMLLPIMLSSLIAYMTARLLKAKHLYQSLSGDYDPILPKDKSLPANSKI